MPFICCSCGVPLSEISLVRILCKELALLFEQVTSQILLYLQELLQLRFLSSHFAHAYRRT